MAAHSLKKTIELYCNARGIMVPAGFARHPASRYVVIRQDSHPAKLVAKTWFNQADVAYYLEHILITEIGPNLNGIDILDFKDGRRLRYSGRSRLESVEPFDPEGTTRQQV
jgi:hypothetical protein